MIVLSSVMQKEIIKTLPQIANKINVVPNSFIFKEIKIISKQNIILHVGNDQLNSEGKYIKGTDLLIKAFCLSKELIPGDCELLIIGNYSKDFRKKHNYEDVVFIGRKSHQDVLAQMKKAKVFALPSRNEAFGQVFIEAIQFGCSLIGTNDTGAEDIIEIGRYGYLIPQEDTLTLATALRDAIQNYNSPEECSNEYNLKMNLFSRRTWINNWNIIIENESVLKKNL
jgi:glycosyltransferase involved in cell wall biosynthesis